MMFKTCCDTLFEEAAKAFMKLFVFFRTSLRILSDMLNKAFCKQRVELLHKGTVLHRLPGNVKREVFRIDDPFHKAHPLGKKPLRLGINQNLATIEGNPSLHLTKTKALMVFVRCEKKSVNVNGSISTKMQSVARFINRMGAVLIELFIILFFNVAFRL